MRAGVDASRADSGATPVPLTHYQGLGLSGRVLVIAEFVGSMPVTSRSCTGPYTEGHEGEKGVIVRRRSRQVDNCGVPRLGMRPAASGANDMGARLADKMRPCHDSAGYANPRIRVGGKALHRGYSPWPAGYKKAGHPRKTFAFLDDNPSRNTAPLASRLKPWPPSRLPCWTTTRAGPGRPQGPGSCRVPGVRFRGTPCCRTTTRTRRSL